MSNSIPALFKKSLIAAAVVSLSACSTTPRIPDYDLSHVGEGILTAGRVTADVSERVWSKTSYLLGFSDGDGETRSDESLLIDTGNVAIPENGTIGPRDTTVRPIVIRNAIPTRTQQEQTPSNAELAETDQAAAIEADIEADFETPIKQNADSLAQTAVKAESTDKQAESTLLAEDRVHKVTASETLWEIAKLTTGDANNWHVLADINDLGPNASVFPGDLLIIPADMVKPSNETSAASEATTSQQAPERVYVNTNNLTESTKSQASASQPQLETSSSSVQSGLSNAQEIQQIDGKAFTLNPGETLWDLAKRTTGDATNWKAIAGQNNLSNEQAASVRAGQTIYVTEGLIKRDPKVSNSTVEPELDTAVNDKPSDMDRTLDAVQTAADTPRVSVEPAPVEAEAPRTLTITSASAQIGAASDSDLLNVGTDLLPESSTAIDAAQSMKIVEATFKSDEIAAPLAPAADTVKSTGTMTHTPDQIMVNGTYYPKAIYNNADFSSSLLMRVSPGTTLQVSKAMGNWFQVKTSKGLGYVHQRDIK